MARVTTFPRQTTPRPALCEARGDDPSGLVALSLTLERQLAGLGAAERGVAFACIGSDRSTGDSLGPLAGQRLLRLGCAERSVIGTLERPLHALNMAERLAPLSGWSPRPVIVAVDAALGSLSGVGAISVSRGGLTPGEGLGKYLPAVGDVSVTATVNVRAGALDTHVLHSTRLYLVQQLADELATMCWWALRAVRPEDATAVQGLGRRASDRPRGAVPLPV